MHSNKEPLCTLKINHKHPNECSVAQIFHNGRRSFVGMTFWGPNSMDSYAFKKFKTILISTRTTRNSIAPRIHPKVPIEMYDGEDQHQLPSETAISSSCIR